MTLLLYVIGGIVLLISVIVGFSYHSLLGFLIAIAGGISSSVIFFALAKILKNQEFILYELASQKGDYKKTSIKPKVVCPKCNYEHDDDYTSCPHCGYRYQSFCNN